MYIVKIYFILFLYFTTIKFGELTFSTQQKNEVKDNIYKYINVWPTKRDKNEGDPMKNFFRLVSFQKGNKLDLESKFICKIYARNFIFYLKNDKTYKLNSFYLCLNCEFARWTKNSLFHLISNLPWYHQTELIYRKNENEFKAILQSIDINELHHLVELVNKFINILSTLIDLEPYSLLSNETIVLQSLFEIKLKILINDRITENNKVFTILEALVVINALQSFILTTCPEDTPYSEITTFEAKQRIFGYSIKPNVLGEMELLLGAIEHITLESHLCCTDEKTYLIRLVVNEDGTPNNTRMSKEIGSTEISLENEEPTSVKEIILRIKNTRETVKLFIYLKYILYAVIKIVHTKVKFYFSQHENIHEVIVTEINKLINRLKSNMFPAELLNYLYCLQEIMPFESRPFMVANKVLDTYGELFKSIKLQNCDFGYTVFEFVEDLITFKDEFMCFNKTFAFLRSTFSRYVTPYSLVSDKITEIRTSVDENDDVQNGCRFVDSVYAICLQITIGVEKIGSFKTDDSDGSENILTVNEKYETMKRYFLWAINGGKIQDVNFLVIAYKAVIILVNKKFAEMEFFVNNFERPVYLIMTELSDYGIKFCSALHERKGYMLYDNVDINRINDDDTIKANIGQSLQIHIASLDVTPTHNQFDLEFLYTYLVNGSDVIEKYKDVVKFYWKGDARSLKEIYTYATSSITLNPHFLFEFYEFSFKFYVVAFYYEIIQFYDYKESPDATCVNEYNLCVNHFSEDSFPETMRPLIKRLKKSATFPTDTFDDLRVYRNFLIKHFQKDIDNFFVAIERREKTENSQRTSSSHCDCIERVRGINKEVSTRLTTVLDICSLFYKDYFKKFVIK